MSVDAPLSGIPSSGGNEAPIDFSGMPALTVTGASQVQVSRDPLYILLVSQVV